MTNRAAASRYARALLDVVVAEARRPVEAGAGADQPRPSGGAAPSTAGVAEPVATLPPGDDGGPAEAVQRIERELAGLAALLARYPVLHQALLNPAIPVGRKRAAVAQLMARAGVAPVLGKLLVLLAERDRMALLPDLLTAYRERVLDYLNVVRAELTTAAPIAGDRVNAVARQLARATGRAVQLHSRVDPSIIGGVVARIGSTVYDGSITRQLARMRERLGESS